MELQRRTPHFPNSQEPVKKVLQVRTGRLVDSREGRRSHQVVARPLSLHLPVQPRGAETGLPGAGSRDDGDDALVAIPGAQLARMEIHLEMTINDFMQRAWAADFHFRHSMASQYR